MKKKKKHREVDQATKVGHCLHIRQPTGFHALILNQQDKL